MVTVTLMGQLQTADGERTMAYDMTEPITVKQLIRKLGKPVRHVFQLLKEKRVMVTVNKRIASEGTTVYDGDIVSLVAHDGIGQSGLTPTIY